MFSRLRRQRQQSLRELSTDTIRDWLVNAASVSYVADRATGQLIPTTRSRKNAAPLNIVGLPGYERLDEAARDLCSELRLTPEQFFEMRKTMADECDRLGGLRLADARPVLKIDVNKTKKLYDHFLLCGNIKRPGGTNNQ